MLANSYKEGTEELGVNISSARFSLWNYTILYYDVVVLTPQVKAYYDDIKKDTDALRIKLIATEEAEYIKLIRNPKRAIQFILSQFK